MSRPRLIYKVTAVIRDYLTGLDRTYISIAGTVCNDVIDWEALARMRLNLDHVLLAREK